MSIIFFYVSTILTTAGSAKFISGLFTTVNWSFTIVGVIFINYCGRKTLMVRFGYTLAVGMFGLGTGMLYKN